MLLELVKIKREFIRDGFGSDSYGWMGYDCPECDEYFSPKQTQQLKKSSCEDCGAEEFWNRAEDLDLDSLTGEELVRINSKLDIYYKMSDMFENNPGERATTLQNDTKEIKEDLEREISRLEKDIWNDDRDYKVRSSWEYILREKPKECREYSNMVSEGRLFMKRSFWDFL